MSGKAREKAHSLAVSRVVRDVAPLFRQAVAISGI
jgi:hypothetical protein